MKHTRISLMEKLLEKKLTTQLSDILKAIEQGFDIYVTSSSQEVLNVFISILTKEQQINPALFFIADNWDSVVTFQLENENSRCFTPIILVTKESKLLGNGFIGYNLPNPEYLISSVSNAIYIILDDFNLLNYIDVFDAKILSLLKSLIKDYGIAYLIDAVIQVAFIGGFGGDQESAGSYLEKTLVSNESNKLSKYNIDISSATELFFSSVLKQSIEPHVFVKLALSYYVVKKQSLSVSNASKALNISRTTLIEHLRSAEKYGINQIIQLK